MRLNGTFLERLIFCVIPITFIAAVLFGITRSISLFRLICIFVFLTLLFWGIDSLILMFKRLRPLKLEGSILFIDNEEVSPNEIVEIFPITDKRSRWDFRIISFQIQKAGMTKIISVMEKPRSIVDLLKGRKSKTLQPLIDEFPELESKIRHRVIQ